MRPPKQISPEDKADLKDLLKKARSKADFQRVQCVWMRAELGMNSTEIGAAVGWSKSTVKIVQMNYFREKERALIGAGRGGRKNNYLTLEEEKNLLESFSDEARIGGVLVVSSIQAAYEREVGRAVAKSTVYRLLARHGWRKIAPRPSHPKSDPVAREEFKKTPRARQARRRKPPRGRPAGPVDVSGRRALWPHLRPAQLLGSWRRAAGCAHAVRAGIHICVCRRQSVGRNAGFPYPARSQHAHHVAFPRGSLFPPSRRFYSHVHGQGGLASIRRPLGSRKHQARMAPALQSSMQPRRAHMG